MKKNDLSARVLSAQNLILLFHVYLAAFVIAAVGILVVKFVCGYEPVQDKVRDYIAEILVNYKADGFDNVLREKKEWLIYVISVLAVTLICFSSLFLSRKYVFKRLITKDCGHFYRRVFFLTIPLFLIFLYFALSPSYHILVLPQKWKIYTSSLTIFFAFLLTIATMWYQVLCDNHWQRVVKIIATIFVAISSLWIVSYGIFDENSMALESYAINFNPVVAPIIQQYLGAELLVNLKSYYGLHAYLTQIFLHIFPATVLNLSLMLAGFFFVALLSLAFVIFSVVENKLLALFGFIALIFVQNFTSNWWPSESAVSFQYESIRLLFPALILLMLTRFYQQPSSKKYYAILMLSATALLWNLDSGIPIFAAAAIFLGHELLKENFAVKIFFTHVARVVVVSAFMALLLLLFVKIDSGQWPNIGWIVYGQKAAKEYAIAMLPCDAAGLWYLVAMIYILGLVFSINNFLSKKHSLQNSLMLAITILGVGLLTYFIGRGNEVNLTHCCFPAIILLTIFADKFCQNFVSKSQVKVSKSELAIFIAPLFFICYLVIVFFCNLLTHPNLREKFISEKFSYKAREANPYWIGEAEFIRKNIDFDDKVRDNILLITTNDQDFYFDLEFKIKSPLQIRDMRQTHYQKDFDAVYDLIKSGKEKFVIFIISRKKEVIQSMSDEEISRLFNAASLSYKSLSRLDLSDDDVVYIYESLGN